MKELYFLRVLVVSFETLTLITAIMLIINFDEAATSFAQSLNINLDIIKYLALLPVGVFVWIVKETKELMFAEKENTKQFVNWPEYWRYKIHVYVSLIFGAIFSVISIIPWILKAGISDGKGLILFSCGIIGILIVATTVFFAQLSIKEIFNIEHNESVIDKAN